jgi:hypothetical protein
MRVLLATSFFLFQIISILSQPFFTSFEPISADLIEWDQVNYTYYTGQTIQMNWTSQNFTGSDLARIQYIGNGGTRTLTTGSGTSLLSESYSIRLSDSSNGIATNVPLTISHSTNTTNSLDSKNKITVIQSKLTNIALLSNGLVVTSGTTLLCDNGNVTISWRGLGQAQFGLVGLTMRSGFGTVVGTALSNIPASANMSVNYTLPRSFNPNGGSTYTTTITVQEPGQATYTGTTVGIRLSSAPSTSPTPTPSFTPSKTPTPSISATPSNTPTPSVTPSATPSPSFTSSTTSTPTPSQTPSGSITSSPTSTVSVTPTPAASLDLAALARNAANSVDTQTPAIAGALGGIGGILLLLGAFKWYQQKVMTEQRKKKLAMSARFALSANSLYGIDETKDDNQTIHPNIVMYTVQNMPPKRNTVTTKKGFPPVQGTSV